MSVAIESVGPAKAPTSARSIAGSTAFLVVFSILSALTVGGIYLDGWAHNHLESTLETFFTPWHAVLYSGYAVTALLVGGAIARGRAAGRPITGALPVGYGSAAIGALVFGVSGALDLAWHTVFGIEANVEALLSPTHLGLATGIVLIAVAPVRAAWARPGRVLQADLPGWAAVLSVALVLAVLQFMTQFANPFNDLWPVFREEGGQAAWFDINQGIDSTLIQSGLLVGALLLLVRRWAVVPFGTATALALIPALGLGFQHDQHQTAFAALAGGLVADALLWIMRPSEGEVWRLRVVAVVFPAGVTAALIAIDQLSYGIAWSIHLWAGLIVLSGVVGLLLSLVAAPPPSPDDRGHLAAEPG